MQLKYPYWYFKKALSLKFCENIIKLGNKIKKKQASVGDKKLKIKDLKKIRSSKIAWLNEIWIYKEIQPFIKEANINAGWNFEYDFTEHCQFTKYSKGEFYTWHCDEWAEAYNDPKDKNKFNKNRKLSVTVSLSDPKNYKGGELEFDLRNNTNGKPNLIKCKEILERGSVVVFPSFLWHRVKPVKQGTRYSLVAWNLGKPFK